MSRYARLIKNAEKLTAKAHTIQGVAKKRPFALIDDTNGSPAPSAPVVIEWVIAVVAPNSEAMAMRALVEAGYIPWHPQLIKVIRFPSRRLERKVYRPLFPRYIFVSGHGKKSMLDCHVQRILTQKPDGALVSHLSNRQDNGEFDISKPELIVAVGVKATIARGPLAGLSGIVTKSDLERVTILMDVMGKMKGVSLPSSHMKAA